MLAIVIGFVLVFLLAANSEAADRAAANSGTANSVTPFSLTWFTLDSGGGRSSGGEYILEGTAGQPDAGLRGGGGLLLSGGFWGRQEWINIYMPVFRR